MAGEADHWEHSSFSVRPFSLNHDEKYDTQQLRWSSGGRGMCRWQRSLACWWWGLCWIRILILPCIFLRSGQSISFCSTPITLSTGSTIPFHVEEEKNLLTSAQHFCLKYFITESDCQRIVHFHRQKCFTNTHPSPPTPAVVPAEREMEDKEMIPEMKEECEENDKLSSISTNDIDYSQRVGPILSVTHKEVTQNLQTYLGETPEDAIKRFCGMLKLSPVECQQVRETFLKLISSKKSAAAMEPPTPSAEDVVPEESATSSESRESSFVSYWRNITDQVTAFLNQYWNYILLLVTVAYVILENPIQL